MPDRIDSIVFDMDGTIVLARDVAIQSVKRGTKEMFEELGIDAELPTIERILDSIGKPSPEYFASLFPDLEPSVRAKIQQRIYQLEAKLLAEGVGSFAPGAPGALVKLRRMGLKLGLASNCGVGFLEANIDAFGLDKYFDMILCSGMRGYPPKAALVKEILAEFGSQMAMMVGDRSYDIEAATECKMIPVGVSYGYGAPGELQGAELVIDNLNQLPSLLDGSNSETQVTSREHNAS
ncbi:MAG: hypothetical protein DRH70_08935 [Candidatus Coatesbacteria bacterium]|nr:MAG: hypothetical protein DRH70_08935 [Candidatus Coatesbacteria bacterium]